MGKGGGGGRGTRAETHRGQAPPPPARSRGDSDGKADRYGLFLARMTAMALILAVSARKTRPSSGKPQVAKTEAALHRRKECHSGQPCHSDTIAVSLATWERGRTSVRGKPRYPHGSTDPRTRHYLPMLGVVERQNARGRSLRTVWALSNPPPRIRSATLCQQHCRDGSQRGL